MKRSPVLIVILLLTALVLLLSSKGFLSLYVDSLWFRSLDYYPVFLKILLTKLTLGLAHALVFFGILYLNLNIAQRYHSGSADIQHELDPLRPFWKPMILLGSLLLSLMIAFQGAGRWEDYLRFSESLPFGTADPIFQMDLGFYVFTLPFVRYLQQWFSSTLVITFLLCSLVYFYRQGVLVDPTGIRVDRQPRRHLFILAGVFLFLLGWSYYLDLYHLLYSERGVVFGAVFADVNFQRPALWVLIFTALIAGAVLIRSSFKSGWALPGIALGSVAVMHFLSVGILPEVIHRFHVLPNEITLETPYIQNNIQATRFGFGLHRIESEEFSASEDLTIEDIARNDLTIQNIRLWDHAPLLKTYGQLQQIRTYYDFQDVDNDRYVIDGQYRQVMLSPRELSYENLPSRIWINEHLTYTHGYGVTLGPVSRISSEGLPEFFIKDIPPAATTDIHVSRPEIYYGEIPNDYVFVKTNALEFDYPSGAENVYTDYEGDGGVATKSLWRKLAFSAYFGSLKIILSNDITSQSRIMYHRNITERAQKMAPYLEFDRDPYMVITQKGELVWILDGYTTSENMPYSQPFSRGINYIRNSVKVTVNAYDGGVNFYISDSEDPVIQVYSAIFPGLFQPLEKMPEDLRSHLRYPQDFFTVQARMYTTYHMQDPQIFYNKEDLWDIPQKERLEMDPYYTIMKLPGETKEEFILLLPLTPAKRDNLGAWLAARSDPPHYGKLIVYLFPKQKLIFGPQQIDNRIDQDAHISQQLTLWGQSGSEVIRGSLLVIPIEDSLLYVSPLFLASSAEGSLPELRRVIASYGSKLVMEKNLDQAIRALFKDQPGSIRVQTDAPGQKVQSLEELIASALALYRQAQENLQQGKWTDYGESQEQLEQLLERLANQARKE